VTCKPVAPEAADDGTTDDASGVERAAVVNVDEDVPVIVSPLRSFVLAGVRVSI
jgi:hypothetical protein